MHAARHAVHRLMHHLNGTLAAYAARLLGRMQQRVQRPRRKLLEQIRLIRERTLKAGKADPQVRLAIMPSVKPVLALLKEALMPFRTSQKYEEEKQTREKKGAAGPKKKNRPPPPPKAGASPGCL